MAHPTRREFLAGVAGLALSPALRWSPRLAPEPTYDTLVRGGMLVDPALGWSGPWDVGIVDGVIAAVRESIPAAEGRRVIDADGMIVTPGLIDIHTHVYPGVPTLGIDPDLVGIARGVTTVVDAGSMGAINFPAFRDHVARPARTRVYALVNMSRVGMTAPNELARLEYVDVDAVVRTIEANPDIAIGIKVRMLAGIENGDDLEVMRRTREAADRAGVPITVHIGGQTSSLPEVIAFLRPGDIITHAFRRAGSILDGNGRVYPEVLDAIQSGIWIDIGHGMGNLDFDVAERILDQGVLPHAISSDVHDGNVTGPVFDLPTTLSKFMALGMSLDQVVEASTATPAKMFTFNAEVGSLADGAPADVSIFQWIEDEHPFVDASGNRRMGAGRLAPYVTLRDGSPYGVARG
ncbi:MAG: amidohydrolase/deacetylase family metallohydrolase [Gemmatimonadota bacterium]